jgi:UTP:GlnB (protein PII) uridylyltransferase
MKEKITKANNHAKEFRKLRDADLEIAKMIKDLEKQLDHLWQVRFNLALEVNKQKSKYMNWSHVKIPLNPIN